MIYRRISNLELGCALTLAGLTLTATVASAQEPPEQPAPKKEPAPKQTPPVEAAPPTPVNEPTQQAAAASPSEAQQAPTQAPPAAPAQPAEPPSAAAAAAAAPVAEAAPRKAEQPQEVTVLGARTRRSAGSDHVISSRKLARHKYDNPLSVLRTVPGVYARTEDGVGLRPNIGLRGANPDRSKKTALMEDGVPIAPAPYSAPAAYYFPMIQRMYQVRVIKGPSAIAYGPQTVGGAIDLMTRPIPSTTSGSIDAAFGSYGSAKVHGYAGFSDDKTGVLLEGIHLRSSGFKELPSGADTGFYRNEWMLKASHVLDPGAAVRNEFRLKLLYSEEGSNETYTGLSDADLRANPLRRYAASALDHMQWHRTGVVAEHELRPSSRMTITTSLYRQDFARVWRKLNRFRGASVFDVLQDPTSPQNAIFSAVLRGEQDSASPAETLLIGPNKRDFVSQGIQTRISVRGQTGPFTHRADYGIRLHYDRINRHHSEDGFLMRGGELMPEGSPTIVTVYNEAWTESLAMHAADTISYRGLSVTPGVRFEFMRSALKDKLSRSTEQGAAHALLPGVGLYQAITEELGVLAGVHRGFSPPPPGSSTAIQPELSLNYEAGIRHSERHARAEIIGYYNDYQNLTDVCTLSSGCVDADLDRQYPAGRAKIYGLEAYFERDFPITEALRIPVNGSYTLTRATFSRSFSSDDPIFGDVKAGDEMPYVPRHQFYGTLGLEHQRAGGYVSLLHVSRMREQAGSGAFDPKLSTDPETIVDLSVHYRPLPWLELYGNVRNVFDAAPLLARRPFGARPAAPRWIQLGAKASF
ncbi:MAG: TonB-dependent receptor [Polyangiaceae bacterium]